MFKHSFIHTFIHINKDNNNNKKITLQGTELGTQKKRYSFIHRAYFLTREETVSKDYRINVFENNTIKVKYIML